MRQTTRWLCCSLPLLALAHPARAQASDPAWSAGAVGAFSDNRSAAGGLVALFLLPYDRIRLAVGVAALADLSGGETPIGRGEVLAQFHVTPYRVTGWGIYATGGLASEVQEGTRGTTRLVLSLGAELAPAKPRSLYVETGLGGGWRVAAGIRWRPRVRR